MSILSASSFLTDEQAVESCPRDINIRAMRGHAIVWFMPFRREGVIEIPDKYKDESSEGIIIHDNTGHGLDPGVKVSASRLAGTYFSVRGKDGREHRVCTMPKDALILVDTAFSPEVA